jgi:hypothetical protein
MDRVKDLDLYQLLEVEQDADEKTLKTAYRKKALTCHPDKNPDNKVNLSFLKLYSDIICNWIYFSFLLVSKIFLVPCILPELAEFE